MSVQGTSASNVDGPSGVDAAPDQGAIPPSTETFAAQAPAVSRRPTSKAPPDMNASLLQSQLAPTDAVSSAGPAAGTFAPHAQMTTTQDGKPGEPINIYIHGSLDDVRAALTKAGFTEALPNTTENKLKYAGEAVTAEVARAEAAAKAKVGGWLDKLMRRADTAFNDPSPAPTGPQAVDNMPISTQFLDGKPQVAAFSSQNDPLAGRHHFRVFDTGEKDAQGKEVYAIQASRDTGIVLDKNRPGQLFMNHAVEKNTDGERDFVVGQLEHAGVVGQSPKVGGMDYGPAGYYGDASVDGAVRDVTLRGAS